MSLKLRTPLPSLEGITEWINGEPDLENARNHPVMVYFWAMSCQVCHENMPELQNWRKKYVPKGLRMISIHCPRMKTDTDIEKVKSDIVRSKIVEPCGIDNRHKVKKAFENEVWPAYYLFDTNWQLKRRVAGRVGLALLEEPLKKLLE